jgi:DMSO reductase anchor subunit
MCVDRLEAGLKPACAAACLGGALDFGVIETKPEGGEQLETRIPGFPDTSITHPNIRFQQTGSLPREMVRTDSTPLRYIRDDRNVKPDPGIKGGQGQYRSAALTRGNKRRSWGLASLRSREDPLVLFTLITQAVVGAFLVLFLGSVSGLPGLDFQAHPIVFPVALFGMIVLLTFGLVLSTLHLGRPHRFYRAFNNLRYSPVSREVAAVAVFYNLLGVYAVLTGMPHLFAWLPEGLVLAVRDISGWLAAVAGPAALYFMHSIYRIPARHYWNHWQVLTAFYGSMLTLGPLFAALIFVPFMLIQGLDYVRLLQFLALPIALGLVLEGFGLYRHARHLKSDVGEADAAGQQQLTTFGKTYLARNIGLGVNTVLVLTLAGLSLPGVVGLSLWAIIAISITALAVVGRALFYAVVIPTTMPGAFFWKNPGFQDHARHSGLAELQQVGVQIVEH